jgi:hypothetical protein
MLPRPVARQGSGKSNVRIVTAVARWRDGVICSNMTLSAISLKVCFVESKPRALMLEGSGIPRFVAACTFGGRFGEVMIVTVTTSACQTLVVTLQRPACACVRKLRRFALQMALIATHLGVTGIADRVQSLFAVAHLSCLLFFRMANRTAFGVMTCRAFHSVLFGVIAMVKCDDGAAAVG